MVFAILHRKREQADPLIHGRTIAHPGLQQTLDKTE
jgi:hypothetical protein